MVFDMLKNKQISWTPFLHNCHQRG